MNERKPLKLYGEIEIAQDACLSRRFTTQKRTQLTYSL